MPRYSDTYETFIGLLLCIIIVPLILFWSLSAGTYITLVRIVEYSDSDNITIFNSTLDNDTTTIFDSSLANENNLANEINLANENNTFSQNGSYTD